MTDKELLDRLEARLRARRRLNEDACDEVRRVAPHLWAAIADLLSVFGCKRADMHQEERQGLEPPGRIAVCRLVFIYFYVDTGDPRWSSARLNEALGAAMQLPGVTLNEPLRALFEVLGEAELGLMPSLRHFIRDVVRYLVAHHRARLKELDVVEVAGHDIRRFTAPQAYLVLYLLTPQSRSPHLVVRMLEAPAGTDVWSEAVEMLDEDLEDPTIRNAVVSWLESAPPLSATERSALWQKVQVP